VKISPVVGEDVQLAFLAVAIGVQAGPTWYNSALIVAAFTALLAFVTSRYAEWRGRVQARKQQEAARQERSNCFEESGD
jgi:uncharacterized membrane protein YhiD involved in acid resistance